MQGMKEAIIPLYPGQFSQGGFEQEQKEESVSEGEGYHRC